MVEETRCINEVHIITFKQGTNVAYHRYGIDIILSSKDADFMTCKKRLLDEERIDEACQKVELMTSDILIGYW